jgi:hypothetical protein
MSWGDLRRMISLVVGSYFGMPPLRLPGLELASKVRPFRLKKFFAYKRNKVKLDSFHLCFTISL